MSKVVGDLPPRADALSNEEIKAMFAAEKAAYEGTPVQIKNDFPTEIIDLPSKGYFYPEAHALASGTIEMKYMTAKEEDILSSATLIKQGVVLDRLIQSLIITKVKYDDLLVADKNALLIASRILAYGPEYSVEVTCPNCGTKNKVDVDLQQFESKDISFDNLQKGKTELDFTFPICKKHITFKFLTHGDEKLIEQDIKGYNKMRALHGVDPQLSTRLKHLITSVEGERDTAAINKFVDNLLSRDSLALRNYLKEITPDIDLTFNFSCNNCDYTNEKMLLPLDVSFFWPGA